MAFYETIAAVREDSPELQQCIEETVQKLTAEQTTSSRPGMLLGKVQAGKTRHFIGTIGLAFDRGYEAAVILTKGTRSLAKQTLWRVQEDFRSFIETDLVQVHDIMNLPVNLTPYELAQRIIFVVKKEDDNLRRLLRTFQVMYPSLREKRLLIIDDEADLASLSFRRRRGETEVGVISSQIDQLRELARESSFLQVTATPYSLYLQPEEEVIRNGNPLFKPKRPAFTVILPIHAGYVGGDHYFERSNDPSSAAYYFFEPVPEPEREALKQEDRRRLRLEEVLQSRNSALLVKAVMNFILGGTIRRMQQVAASLPQEKYSFLFHTEFSRCSHDWQCRVLDRVNTDLTEAARSDSPIFDRLLEQSYNDLWLSMELAGAGMPPYAELRSQIRTALLAGHLMITKVNSDSDIEALLGEDAQLRRRTPFNLFIGGQILDRGITISNLIGFYYGRTPKTFRQDTVLQHSRMYGSRPVADLPVTRFYSTPQIYQVMRRIHEFDSALREAFLSGAHERGVYFLQKDSADHLVPCSPNKLSFSGVTTIRPGRRVVATDFQTVSRTAGQKNLEILDQRLESACGGFHPATVLVDVREAAELLELCHRNMVFENPRDEQSKIQTAVLEHFSQQSDNAQERGKVWLVTAVDREISRHRAGGRFSDAPDTASPIRDGSERWTDIPALLLLRQNGKEEHGWRGLPFWWPVILTPTNAITSVFAASAPNGS